VIRDLAFFDGVSGDGELESEVLVSGSGLMSRFLDMVGLDVMVFSLGLWFVRRMREGNGPKSVCSHSTPPPSPLIHMHIASSRCVLLLVVKKDIHTICTHLARSDPTFYPE
jgi:hypothetical protein